LPACPSGTLGDPAVARPGSAAAEPGQIAADAVPKNGDAHAGGTQRIMTGDDPVAVAGTRQQFNGPQPAEELTK
jgi:hypothetical protein